jgi:Derlin-2/3
MADGGGPRELWDSIKPVTRTWLALCIATLVGGRFGLVDIATLLFRVDRLWRNFELWRPVTVFLFMGMPSFPTLLRLYNLYKFGQGLEMNPFPSGAGAHEGNQADHVWQLAFTALMTLVIGSCAGLQFLGPSLLSGVIYLWSKRNPNVDTSLWFFKMKALWLPWAMVALQFVLGENPVLELIGIAAAHVYFFLHEVMPGMELHPWLKGRNFAATPDFLYEFMGLAPTHMPPGMQRVNDQRAAFRAAGGAGTGGGGGGGGGGGAPPPRFVGQGHVLGGR